MITVSALNALATVRHGFFTRNGGVSEGIYASRNCGFGSADDPAHVRTNRARCMLELEVPPENLVTVNQKHTTDVVVVDGPFDPDAIPVADAIITTRPRLAVGVLTADCAPVLLADGTAGVVAAVHAGWKGALNGVIDNTIARMEDLGAKPRRIVAGIGPCIAQRSYEVGPEFPAPFLAEEENNVRFFAPSRRDGYFMFDLPGYVARRLARLNIGEVMPTPCDTCREESRFFSYRRTVLRGETDYGRMLSAITLER
ncbi:peptidoglycan editing factor PgeF [Novispirillum itersonii]|uniref:peptidoglycan editing factor PgeF n=1 Tax=Novispirillum itersonii TaxID=189 RepID=UPI00036E90C3|nr:peptidoglycan editing factor PgeF [Novispirillum itersonii]